MDCLLPIIRHLPKVQPQQFSLRRVAQGVVAGPLIAPLSDLILRIWICSVGLATIFCNLTSEQRPSRLHNGFFGNLPVPLSNLIATRRCAMVPERREGELQQPLEEAANRG